ncbi:hypothetical protein BDK51DRAFT_34767 [Blyttiomyces helicus]|uniref:SH3 domain-containing protein n=1 Tax=Blyttiomyces helicus TaxID=388810 RepID=A0A4P9W9Q5_9FUNG|nr:hypothetical protein BDK51DRAFT_34767 [Blyttiomyces helicus]|eukprot:RKO87550.1 hypothetical protein BDK51DRAFT_34767 [Blyttiomyces helicus]
MVLPMQTATSEVIVEAGERGGFEAGCFVQSPEPVSYFHISVRRCHPGGGEGRVQPRKAPPRPLLAPKDVWRYEIPSAEWSLLPPVSPPFYDPEPSASNCSTVAICIGSTIFGSLPDGTFASFDTSSRKWTLLAQLDTPLSGSTAFSLNGNAYFVGYWAQWVATSASTQVYNPTSNAWTMGPDYPHTINAAGSAVIGDVALQADSWDVVPEGLKNPAGREYPCLAAWNETLVLWGGYNQAKIYTDRNMSDPGIWTFASGSWAVHPSNLAPDALAPTQTILPTCSVVGSVMYIWTSFNQTTGTIPYGLLHKLNLTDMTWISGPNIRTSMSYGTATAAASSSRSGSQSSRSALFVAVAIGGSIIVAVVVVTQLAIRYRSESKTRSTQQSAASPPQIGAATVSTRTLPAADARDSSVAPMYDGDIEAVPQRADAIVDVKPSPKVYRALSGFKPRLSDEAGLKLGDQIVIESVQAGGWAMILNLTTMESGLAPLAAIDAGKDFSRGSGEV